MSEDENGEVPTDTVEDEAKCMLCGGPDEVLLARAEGWLCVSCAIGVVGCGPRDDER